MADREAPLEEEGGSQGDREAYSGEEREVSADNRATVFSDRVPGDAGEETGSSEEATEEWQGGPVEPGALDGWEEEFARFNEE